MSVYLGLDIGTQSVKALCYDAEQRRVAATASAPLQLHSGSDGSREQLRFAACYWHTFCAKGSDPFGADTQVFPWDEAANPMAAARARMDAAFEFFTKLGVPYYCFHDRDMAPAGGLLLSLRRIYPNWWAWRRSDKRTRA